MTRNTYSMLEDRIRTLEQKVNNYEKLIDMLINQIEFVQKVMPASQIFKQEFAPPPQPPPEYNQETSNYEEDINTVPKVLPPKSLRRVT